MCEAGWLPVPVTVVVLRNRVPSNLEPRDFVKTYLPRLEVPHLELTSYHEEPL